jgi:TIR domain
MSTVEAWSSGPPPQRGSQPRIFISYRRSDSAAIVGHIYERLVVRYTKASVFRDIDDIPLGSDFYDKVKRELSCCDIVLVVIGPRWFGTGSEGSRRIQQADDPVRVEVEAALESGAAVIPVLVEDAGMPKRNELPDSLKGFEARSAAEIKTGKDFDFHVANLIASMDAILADRGKFVVNFPTWASTAAVGSAAVALLLSGGLVAAAKFGPGVSAGVAVFVLAAASLGFAVAGAFACGAAAAKRRIPFTFCQKHPRAFSAGAGGLAFILLFLFGTMAGPYLAVHPSDGPLQIANRLRGEFVRARDQTVESRDGDFRQAEKLVDALKSLDPQNGHAWYFAGEIRRVRNSALFTAKSCFKGWSDGKPGSLEAYQQDFYYYREIAITLPAVETGGDPGSEACYNRAKGYCVQRMAWIHHLLANDFYMHARALTGRDRLAPLSRAREFAVEARKYRRPEGGEGFDQCIDTTDLIEKIDDEIKPALLLPNQRQSR